MEVKYFTLEAPKPPIISTNSVPATEKKGTFASLATAFARIINNIIKLSFLKKINHYELKIT